jgi:hypothetical protein
LALLGVAASALVAREASAADALALSWDAPLGCPSAAEVREAALRTASSDVASEPLEAEVHVDHRERWTVTIRTRRSGVLATERHLEAASCAASCRRDRGDPLPRHDAGVPARARTCTCARIRLDDASSCL